MAFCTKCGAENSAGAAFCQRCGQPVSTPAPTLSPGEPPVLNAPHAAAKPRKGADIALLIINLVLFAAIQAVLIFVVSVFAAMFADFGAKLPWPAQLLIDGAAFWKSWDGLMNGISWLLIAVAILAAAKRTDLRSWFVLVAVLQALVLLAMAFAVFAPIAELGQVAGGIK